MFDTQPISDAVPVRRDASPDTPRSASGGFTGPGWVELATAPPPLAYTALADAGRILETQLATAIDRLLCEGRNRTSEAALPVAALQASPGAGKSRAARQHLAARDDIGGDIVWHAPTLALAEEACAHALELGADAHVFRGRSALDPATRAPMCAKPDLATKVARAGLPVGRTLCRREDDDGNA